MSLSQAKGSPGSYGERKGEIKLGSLKCQVRGIRPLPGGQQNQFWPGQVAVLLAPDSSLLTTSPVPPPDPCFGLQPYHLVSTPTPFLSAPAAPSAWSMLPRTTVAASHTHAAQHCFQGENCGSFPTRKHILILKIQKVRNSVRTKSQVHRTSAHTPVRTQTLCVLSRRYMKCHVTCCSRSHHFHSIQDQGHLFLSTDNFLSVYFYGLSLLWIHRN